MCSYIVAYTYSSVSFTILATGNLYQIAVRVFLGDSQTIAGLRTVLSRNWAVLAVLLWPCLPSKWSGALTQVASTPWFYCSSTAADKTLLALPMPSLFQKQHTYYRGSPILLCLCLEMWSSFHMNLSSFKF